ncbi:uncharacterized protein LOC135375885 isoform X2 [Ornithodoros turicata]|uniref:uncharacterized protein LOC135375885 isoform X2 n=1 Tax=Ornithodoros turicata TaxID=34597 RepID=UPI003139C715
MYALVRYIDDIVSRFYTIPVAHIKDFEPTNTSDSDKKKVYSAFWEHEESAGYYKAQIYMLGETEREIVEKRQKKRMAKPRLDNEYEIGDPPIAKKQKNDGQRVRKNRAAAQQDTWQDILREHVPESKKRKARIHESDIDSVSSSDCLVAADEVKKAEAEATFWRRRYEAAEKKSQLLETKVSNLEECLHSKMLLMEPAIERFLQAASRLPETTTASSSSMALDIADDGSTHTSSVSEASLSQASSPCYVSNAPLPVTGPSKLPPPFTQVHLTSGVLVTSQSKKDLREQKSHHCGQRWCGGNLGHAVFGTPDTHREEHQWRQDEADSSKS